MKPPPLSILVASLAALGSTVLPFQAAIVPALEAGDIVVANYRAGGNTVLRINPDTGVQRVLGVFSTPTDVLLAPGGVLYVSEWSGAIRRLNLVDGTITLVNSNSSFSQVWGMALGPGGDLFITTGAGNQVVRIDPATGAETPVTQDDRLSMALGIDFLDADHAVVASMLNSRVVSVRLSDQTQSVVAPDAHAFNQPWGIAVLGTNIYVGAHDSKLLQRISGTNVTELAQLAATPFGIGAHTNGDILVGISGGLTGPFAVVRVSADGEPLATYTGGRIGEVTGVEVARASVLAAEQANTPPVLAPLLDQEANEEDVVAFFATAGDTNWPLQNLSFSLEPDAPAGANITPDGVFTWRPSEAQGPGQYTLTVRVTDDGTPPLFTTNSFVVTVNEMNSPPRLSPLTNRTVVVGTPIEFTAQAQDLDLPQQTLSFSLGANAPQGATLTPAGQFSWTPQADQAPGFYPMQVIVTDDVMPPLSATNQFAVTVLQTNAPPVFDTIQDRSIDEGGFLSFDITATDSNVPQQSLSFSLAPDAPAGTRLTPQGRFTWTPAEDQGPANWDIGVIVTDSGFPPLSTTGAVRIVVNEVNRRPVLLPLPDTNVLQGATVTLDAQGSDADLPPQVLTYSLSPNAPAGATISAQGKFSWTPDVGQAPSTNQIEVRVTDDGTPALSVTQAFTITVRAILSVRAGDVLAVDNGGGALYKIDPQTGAAQHLHDFSNPTDVAVSTNGVIYVSEWSGLIKRLDILTGESVPVNPGTSLTEVWGLTIGPAGELYVTCSASNSVVRIDPATGAEEAVAEGGLLSGPYGVAVLDAGHLAISSFNSGQVVQLSLADKTQTLLPTVPEILNPWGVAVHSTNVFVAGFDQMAVEKISGSDAAILAPTEGLPFGLCADTNGDVLAGVSGDTTGLCRIHPDGSSTTLTLAGLAGPITGLEVSPVQIGVPPSTNQPPTPSSPVLQRYPTGGAKARTAALLGIDPNGDPLFLSAVDSASAQGGVVSTNLDWVIYTPPAGLTNQDTFGYTVADGQGGFAVGTVTVVVLTNAGPAFRVTWPAPGGGPVGLRGIGIPGRPYRIDFADSLAVPVWTPLGVVESDEFGLFDYLDQPPPGASNRFYRAVCP